MTVIVPNTKVDFVDTSKDAFGSLRVSSTVASLFDFQPQYDKGLVYWFEKLEGVATSVHDADEMSVTLAVTASAADKATRQTKEYLRYQPGHSQLIRTTGTFGAAVVGVDRRMGYFDDDNGIFLEQNGTTALNLVLRDNLTGTPNNTKIAQADWNKNTLLSGVDVLDITKSQQFIIDFSALYVGKVTVAIEINERPVIIHVFNETNTNTGAYISTANLPIRYELDTAGTNAASMTTICSSAISETGFDNSRASLFSAGIQDVAGKINVTTGAFLPIVSIRPKLTFNSVVNRGLILPIGFNIWSEDKAAVMKLVWGADITAGAWVSANADSMAEFNITATGFSGGVDLPPVLYADKKIAGPEIDRRARYPLSLDIDGAHPTVATAGHADTLTIIAKSIDAGAGATDVFGSINWAELRG